MRTVVEVRAGRGSPMRKGRGRLDRPTIVAAAIAVARTEGLSAVTMRRIADELGCGPMSLYRHVADRDALVLEMLDVVAAGIEVPPPVTEPRAELVAVLTAVHAALAVEHWAVLPLVIERLASPRILPLVERVFVALARAGVAGRDVVAVNQLLWQFVYGELLWTHHDRPATFARQMVHNASSEQYPALAAAVRDLPDVVTDHFDQNLRRLLDGVLPGSVTASRDA
ncbi:TetR/AcrR family transcriptional regulator [Pseudonocardia hispaniensis]|uniref:TetR/AcrR family transcriptional regulator n=1 Tax=Pseudonocardia hispaniensis TaxID=904933 RepID=A0ABW1J4B0_9PSEU